MISFFQKYNIMLGHSMEYYPKGNGLAESSNKSMINIIKKVLNEKKKTWHVHLKYALWENGIGTKKSIGTSPFQMVYEIDVVLPNQLIEVQQHKVEVDERLQKYQDNMKTLFDHKTKDKEFLLGDLVLRWDDRKEESTKHGKFDHIWYGPFRVAASEGKNLFLLENLHSKILNAPINGRYLKHYMQ